MARAMKDSGIEWIGEIPAGWEVARVSSCFSEVKEKNTDNLYDNALQFKMGRIIPKPRKWDAEEIGETYSAYTIVHPGTIMVNGLNLEFDFVTQRVAIVEENGIITSAYIAMSPNDSVDADYMCYLLKAYDYRRALHNMGKGLRKILNYSELKTKPILLPPLSEQRSIVKALNAECARIDAVIEQTRASIEEYKKLKQSVITRAVTKGIRPGRKMKDSGIEWIGEIPEEWDVNSIKNLAATGSGGTPDSGDQSLYDGDINWICSYDLKEAPITESGRKITQAGADAIAGQLQPKGSVLIAMYGGAGTIGNSGIIECEARTNQAICSIKFNNSFILDYYGFFYIMAIRKHWMIYAVGTRKDPNISQDIVRRMPCVIPPIPEQEEIIKYLNEITVKIDDLVKVKEHFQAELESYKKSLIFEYVTGKKEVFRKVTQNA